MAMEELETTPDDAKTTDDVKADDAKAEPKDGGSRPTRFRVVKLVSSEPYLRGRWNCKDFQSKETAKERQSDPVAKVEAPQEAGGVAIDNKIEQAMDLVKSHLMFAVREEVDVLKERIKELETEIQILRAHASNDTLQLLHARDNNQTE